MRNLEKRMRDLEELVFKVVLETKAETMAIRDILMERDLVSRKRWDELVNGHKTSYSYFEVVKEIEKKNSSQESGNRGQQKPT